MNMTIFVIFLRSYFSIFSHDTLSLCLLLKLSDDKLNDDDLTHPFRAAQQCSGHAKNIRDDELAELPSLRCYTVSRKSVQPSHAMG